MLKGNIYITDNLDVIQNAPQTGVQIISLDEDGALDLIVNCNYIGGTCLLPPIDAKIAESDGDEVRYDTIYSTHLLQPYQRQFIASLIGYLFRGLGDIIFYIADIEDTITAKKFIFFMTNLYGIHIGLIGHLDPQVCSCYYDNSCIPMWLKMIYEINVISPYEFLELYPLNAVIPKEVIVKMNYDLCPYGVKNIKDVENFVRDLHEKIQMNNKVRPVIEAIEPLEL